jgi:DNA (cytosine-5)-methyltransferase 1
VLAHHYPDVPNLGDMTQFKEWPDYELDVLVGGTPCQSFSVAGLRKGLRDPRGNLALVFLAIADRYRPQYVVWENVPGVLSSHGGRDFGSFLGALAELGYGWAYRVLDAQYFGVPQRRRRVFVVGCLGDWRRAASVLFERESLSGNPAPPRDEGAKSACDAVDAVGGEWWDGEQVAQTLDAVLYKKQCLPEKNRFPVVRVPAWVRCPLCEDFLCALHGGHAHECECPDIDGWCERGVYPYGPEFLRYLTPRECERLQGFPDDFTQIPYRNKPADKCPDGPRYKALGNSMAVPVMAWIGEGIDDHIFEEFT